MFASTDYDSVLSIGGRSHRQEGFLSPQKIALNNRQSLFLLDDVQRKITWLNPNLRVMGSNDYLSLAGSLNALSPGSEWFPISFAISPAGEQYILNQFDNKVYKLNVYGEIESSFGGLDYGAGSLYDPVDIQVNGTWEVWVSDTSAQQHSVFDLFGVFRYLVRPPCPFRWSNSRVYGRILWCWHEQQVYLQNLDSKRDQSFQLEAQRVKDIVQTREYVYLLLENAIHLYPLERK